MDLSTTDLTDAERAEITGKIALATGGAAPAHAWRMLAELAGAAVPGGALGAAAAEAAAGQEDAASPVVAAFEAAMALAPRDPLEGMLVAQMAAVHAAAMRCLARAAECSQYPKIEALYLREAARMLHLFQRQSETLDRRARRPGPPQRDPAAAGEGEAQAADGEPRATGARPAPDGQQVLEKVLAELRERVAERERREAESAVGDEGGKSQGAIRNG